MSSEIPITKEISVLILEQFKQHIFVIRVFDQTGWKKSQIHATRSSPSSSS